MDSGIGTCRCPENTHVARETRDGWVCVSLKDQGTGGTSPLYFICPLPEGAGFKIALNDPAPELGSFPVGCTTGSPATVEPVTGLHGGASCIWPSTGEYVGDIYDCIHTAPSVKLQAQFPQSQYAPSADGVCCPSRALACVQPQVTGPNPTEPRWWYNSVTGTCQQFLWDPAATEAQYHSANNFRFVFPHNTCIIHSILEQSIIVNHTVEIVAQEEVLNIQTRLTFIQRDRFTGVLLLSLVRMNINAKLLEVNISVAPLLLLSVVIKEEESLIFTLEALLIILDSLVTLIEKSFVSITILPAASVKISYTKEMEAM